LRGRQSLRVDDQEEEEEVQNSGGFASERLR
jgi:hypothetical protein